MNILFEFTANGPEDILLFEQSVGGMLTTTLTMKRQGHKITAEGRILQDYVASSTRPVDFFKLGMVLAAVYAHMEGHTKKPFEFKFN